LESSQGNRTVYGKEVVEVVMAELPLPLPLPLPLLLLLEVTDIFIFMDDTSRPTFRDIAVFPLMVFAWPRVRQI
jgi:hypothetical protein